MPSISRLSSQAEALAQFKQFTDFARKSGGLTGRTVAQVGGPSEDDGDEAFASISAKSRFDFIGNIGRRQQSKAENDDVRDLFKESVVKMCGCADEQHLPEAVKTAMKLEDYNKGRPLTARRILAVQTAVRQHEMEQMVFNAGRAEIEKGNGDMVLGVIKLNNGDKVLTDTVKDRIKTAVSACGNDPDAFAVLKEAWKTVLFELPDKESKPMPSDADFVLRGYWAVRNRAGNIASDVQSLRKITGDDEVLFNAAKPFLALRDDRYPLSNSLLANMVAAVQRIQPSDLAEIGDLGTNPGTLTTYKALLKLQELIDNACTNSGLDRASKKAPLPDEDFRRKLLASMIIARAIPDKATLDRVQANLHADDVRALKDIYTCTTQWVIKASQPNNPRVPDPIVKPNDDISVDGLLKDKVSDVCMELSFSLNTFVRTVDQMSQGVSSDRGFIKQLGDGDFYDRVDDAQALNDTVTIMRDIWAKTEARVYPERGNVT